MTPSTPINSPQKHKKSTSISEFEVRWTNEAAYAPPLSSPRRTSSPPWSIMLPPTFAQQTGEPGNNSVPLEKMITRIHIGQTKKLTPAQTGRKPFTLPAFGGIGKTRLVQITEVTFTPGHPVRPGYQPEITVNPPFRTKHGPGSQGGHQIGKIKLPPETGHKMTDGIGRRARAVSISKVMAIARSRVRHMKS